MNNFGLGLILSCTDHASAGIQNATRNFQGLSQAVDSLSVANGVDSALMSISVAAGAVGDELYSLGQGITSMFTGVIKNVTDTGTTIANARTQLATLYKSDGDGAGDAKLQQIKDFAKESIFSFESLIPSVIMLKANGIEAFDSIASSTGKANQNLLQYASDLAAFNPQMKNAYGTGIQAAMGALNEYIAEGNAMSLKRGASLDINQLIGEDTAGTIEERSRQVADLIEQLGMVGTASSMAQTPVNKLSNAQDALFNLMTEISDSGVYETYSNLISKFTDYIMAIPDEELAAIGDVIGEALTSLMKPLEKVVDLVLDFADKLRELVKTNPQLVQTTVKMIALVGVFSLLAGVGLKLASSLGMLKITLNGLFGAKALKDGSRLLGVFKGFFKYIAPIIALVTLFKLAWDRNFMGIQETTESVITKVWESLKLIVDAFTDNTLSGENFQKAKDMGLLPFIEGILQLKYHWDFFVEGFKAGLDSFFETISDILVKTGILDADVSGLGELVVALIEKMTAPGMTDTWREVGAFLGEAAGWLLVFIAVLPTIIKGAKLLFSVCKGIYNVIAFIVKLPGRISAIITKIVDAVRWVKFLVQYFWQTNGVILKLRSAFSTIGTVLRSLGSKLIQFFPKLLGGLKTVVMAILTAIGHVVVVILGAMGIVVTLPEWIVGLIVVAIAALIALIVVFWDEIKAFFIKIGTAIGEFFAGVWDKISQNPIVQSITRIFSSIFNTVKTVVMGIWDVLKSLFTAIWDILKSVFNVIKSVVMGVWNIIKSVAGLIGNIFYAIYEILRTIVLAIIWVFQQLWEGIKTGLEWVGNLFATVFGWIYDTIISPIVDAISTAFNWLCDNVFTPVGDFISGVFEKIADVVEWVCDIFTTAFGAVKDFLCEAFQTVSDIVTPILDGIADAISWIVDGITSAIDTVSGWFGNVGDFFSDVGDGLSEAVGLATGGYVKTTGIAMLHPNEVVVNDVLTQRLGAFLSDYDTAKFTSSPLITQDVIATDDYQERDDNVLIPPAPVNDDDGDEDTPKNDSPMRALVNNSVDNSVETTETSEDDNSTNDNRIIFEAGSVVLQVGGDSKFSDDELYAMADKLMKIMARKMQLRELQTRK